MEIIKDKFGTVKCNVVLKGVVIKYPYLYERSDKGYYSAAFLISKEDKQNLDKLKSVFSGIFTEVGKKIKTPLEDGDQKDWEGYDGNFYINTTQYAKNEGMEPKLVGSDGVTNLRVNKDEDIQGNDTVNVKIEFYAKSNDKTPRIFASLKGVQFVKQGERYIPQDENDDLGFEPVVKPTPKPATLQAKDVEVDDLDDIFGN